MIKNYEKADKQLIIFWLNWLYEYKTGRKKNEKVKQLNFHV